MSVCVLFKFDSHQFRLPFRLPFSFSFFLSFSFSLFLFSLSLSLFLFFFLSLSISLSLFLFFFLSLSISLSLSLSLFFFLSLSLSLFPRRHSTSLLFYTLSLNIPPLTHLPRNLHASVAPCTSLVRRFQSCS